MFEHNYEPLLPRPQFIRRQGRYAVAALLMVAVAWLIGILGYRVLEGMAWIAVVEDDLAGGKMLQIDPLSERGPLVIAQLAEVRTLGQYGWIGGHGTTVQQVVGGGPCAL